VIGVDKDRRFYADANSRGITDQRRLWTSWLRKLKEEKLREKQNDGRNGATMTLISHISISGTKYSTRNMERFYDPYTRETREAFERGSGI
jgi:hypothetical protein